MESENRSDQIEHKKQRRWKKPFIHLLKPLSAGVIGSVLTLTLSTHLDTTQTQTENATEEVASATSETVSDIEVDTVSATSTSITDVIEETSEAVVGIVNLQTQHILLQTIMLSKMLMSLRLVYMMGRQCQVN